MIKLMSDDFTLVLLAWRKRRRNHRLLFGHPARKIRLDWQRRLAVFKPGDIFAYERWDANKFGTQNWSISVLQAGRFGDSLTQTDGVRPGAKMLIHQNGKIACKALLATFDALKIHANLDAIPPEKWHLLSHRLEAQSGRQSILADIGLAR